MKQFAILFVSLVLCVPCLGQEFLSSEGDCYIDPITKRQVCPLKKAAAVTGAVVSKVGAAITPDCICGPNCQCNAGGTPCTCPSVSLVNTPVQSVPSYSYKYQSGWSKSWHTVPNQPVRNGIRRLLGR